MNGNRLIAVLTAICGLLAALSISLGVTIVTTDDGNGNQSKDYNFHVNESKGDGAPTKELTVPATIVEKAATQITDKDLRDETPEIAEQVAPGELTAAQEAAARIRATQPPLPTAGASQGFIGCRTQFVRNQSGRNGTRPQLQVLHYTVSRNILGWADVNSIVALFDRSAFAASSNFVIDAEGHCAYIVPIESKAWTQAAANPYSISYEIINYGNELSFMTSAGYAKLRSVMEQVSARTGIPMRTAVVNGCVPVKSGITQHAAFGYCGGGHHDIGPFPFAKIVGIITKKQPVTKQVKWLNHRKAISRTYQTKCKHPYQRERRPVTCAKLRSEARKLDKLLARKPS